MSGFYHGDGYSFDKRVQFGLREAPVLCGRQSCFILWAIRRELGRLDAEYAPRAQSVIQWLAERRELKAQGTAGTKYQWAALSYLRVNVRQRCCSSIH